MNTLHAIRQIVIFIFISPNGRRWTAFKMLTGTPAGKRPLKEPRRRWEDNIRMDLKKKKYQYEELG